MTKKELEEIVHGMSNQIKRNTDRLNKIENELRILIEVVKDLKK